MKPLIVLRRNLPTVLGLSASTVKRMVARGEFPRPREVSPGLVGWRMADLEAWIAARPETLPGKAPKGQA
jgi:prophage regulatory protein